MKILITVEFYYATGGGGMDEQAKQIAEGLVRLGHEVTVATTYVSGRPRVINGVTIEGFAIRGNNVSGIVGEKERYIEFLKRKQWEVLINLAANIWTTDLAFSAAKEIPAIKILSTPGMSKLGNPIYEKDYQQAYIPALQNYYDAVVYTSANYKDKLFGDTNGIGDKAQIIPNGAAEAEFLAISNIDIKKELNIKTPKVVITVANHYFAKGHNFVISAFRKMRRKDVTLVIFGGRPARHSWYSCYPFCWIKQLLYPRIKLVVGAPRELVVAAYKQSDLFMFGSRLECAPLVMYESFAAQLPIIARPAGNISDYSQYLQIVQTPSQMAREANKLLNDQQLHAQVSKSAFELWEKEYTWTAVVEKYEKLIRSLYESKAKHHPADI
jgi:glycosyltransferase involved in cell wall biosynthesis